jgi:hypothetical protein
MGVPNLIRRTLLDMLDGVPEEDVRSLCVRGNTIADLAIKGRYKCAADAAQVAINVRILSRLTCLLGYPRRKLSVPRVEIIEWGRKEPLRIAPSEVVTETREECLLAKIAGPSIRTQLDIQRECIPCDSPIKELQGEKQVLDLVSQNSVERVQPGPAVQAS